MALQSALQTSIRLIAFLIVEFFVNSSLLTPYMGGELAVSFVGGMAGMLLGNNITQYMNQTCFRTFILLILIGGSISLICS